MRRQPGPSDAPPAPGGERARVRTSQTLLGVPALLLMHLMLALEWQRGWLPQGGPLLLFAVVSLLGCCVFYALVRTGLGVRLSGEPSLTAPQMVYAMVCVAWGYTLAGPMRPAVLCLLPQILCFGIFALQPSAARWLAGFGIGLMGGVTGLLALLDPAAHPPVVELVHWAFVAQTMVMTQVLSTRLGRLRARLSAQKAELRDALDRIHELATRDELTGLPNRRAAMEALRAAAAAAARQGTPLAVVLADLDHFKLVNDSYGHHAGDRVLKAYADVARTGVREPDIVARWGGEEFLFVLAGADERQAAACLDRVRAAYAAVRVEGLAVGHRLDFSAGVALCRDAQDIDAAVERADRALYAAKQAGRGRTCGQERGLAPLQGSWVA